MDASSLPASAPAHYVIGIDDSEESLRGARYVFRNYLNPQDVVELVTVPPEAPLIGKAITFTRHGDPHELLESVRATLGDEDVRAALADRSGPGLPVASRARRPGRRLSCSRTFRRPSRGRALGARGRVSADVGARRGCCALRAPPTSAERGGVRVGAGDASVCASNAEGGADRVPSSRQGGPRRRPRGWAARRIARGGRAFEAGVAERGGPERVASRGRRLARRARGAFRTQRGSWASMGLGSDSGPGFGAGRGTRGAERGRERMLDDFGLGSFSSSARGGGGGGRGLPLCPALPPSAPRSAHLSLPSSSSSSLRPLQVHPTINLTVLPKSAFPGRAVRAFARQFGPETIVVMGPRKVRDLVAQSALNVTEALPTGRRGSSAHVVRHCPTRVLLCPPRDAINSPQNVLVAWDGKHAGAAEALEWAATRVIRPGGTLYLAHVMIEPGREVLDKEKEKENPHFLFWNKATKYVDLMQVAGREIDRLVAETRRKMPDGAHLRGAILPPVDGESQEGASLIAFAQKRNVDTIVLGTRSRGRLINQFNSAFRDISVTDFLLKKWDGGLFVFRREEGVKQPEPEEKKSFWEKVW